MNHQKIAKSFQSLLNLDHPPVALARVEKVPEGIPWFEGEVPSSCSFWPRAEKEVFATRAKDHMNCPIGGMVMGFTLTEYAQAELQKGIQLMCQVNYLEANEAGHIPTLKKSDAAIVYGPLEKFPTDPQLVLLWLQPAQAMLLREATGDSHWSSDLPGGVFGRPACTALAVAARGNQAALSFGCTGMREFTGVDSSQMLAVLTGDLLPDLENKLKRVHESNCRMKEFYQSRKLALRLQPKLPETS